ncbi:hypothetical protein HALO113_70333 [Halomonas sp. 113]|nr:hypothetical protein HALO113_70333 [Halomonas sp. 113]CAD5288095.1 hypothetical protein HALOI3_50167 [Halomonas sp. I3]VXB12312.1 hypothetical protein HALO153_110167 [Halomonas titanicae]VXC21247.1 hypothetical protein HALO98_50337 [Halomonas titanicae]
MIQVGLAPGELGVKGAGEREGIFPWAEKLPGGQQADPALGFLTPLGLALQFLIGGGVEGEHEHAVNHHHLSVPQSSAF